MTLDRLLAAAGSQTEKGDLSNIKIIRQDGNIQLVNLEEYFEDSRTGENPLLQPGDIVIVEELKGIWDKVLRALFGLNMRKSLPVYYC